MRGRYLVPLVLLLAACGTQTAMCPVDTTSAIDATITQVADPVGFSVGKRLAPVEFAININNRSGDAVKVTAISLAPPNFVGGGSQAPQQCLGLDRLDNDIRSVTQGFDRTIPAGGSATFDMRSTMQGTQPDDPQLFHSAQNAVTLYIRTESAGRTRSERLTRRITS